MPIDFGLERWECIRKTYDLWWKGELDRPLVNMVLANRQPDRPRSTAPYLSQACCADLSIPVEDLIDTLDWSFSQLTYLADSFPMVNMTSFGPGVGAAFAGAILDNSTGGVWFHSPYPDRPIKDIHLEYDPNNIWLTRIKDIGAAAMKRWQGQVLVGMTDLGGNLDILQSFLTAEGLLMELYDNPQEVLRLLWEEHELWHRWYEDINSVLQPINPGFSDWSGIYSDRPSYILQCDFSYMIGPEMFAKFVRPELEATCKRLHRTIYHLDGKGQLPHLDQLLAMKDLDGVQWVCGAGNGPEEAWPEVRRKIGMSGKKAQTWGSLDTLQTLIEQAGTSKGIHHIAWWPDPADEAGARRKLAEFGIE